MYSKNIIILSFVLISIKCLATTVFVGSGQTYTTPNALYQANILSDGDTVLIEAGNYIGLASLAKWSNNNLVIKGIGGRPHMIANGSNLQGKSIWITSGDSITIENIEFSGCSVPDQNGAGIRGESNTLTIRYCYFHHNENGILTNNPYQGHLLVEYSEFAYNGFGQGYTHNIYVGHIDKLTFRYNYSHHAIVGHNLKSRATENIITYNRIMDEDTGNSSRLIDISNGGKTVMIGNLLMQGQNALNNNMVGYAKEGLSNSDSTFYFANNTMVNKRAASCKFLDINTDAKTAIVVNNIFAGTGTLVSGTTTQMRHNYASSNIATVQMIDEANYNYRLSPTSPVINLGLEIGLVNGLSLKPIFQYVHVTDKETRYMHGPIDVGAYEFGPACTATYPTYTFNGNYDQDWDNGQNWDNGCVPPNNFDGPITIQADCQTFSQNAHLANPNVTLIITAGNILTMLN